MGDILKRISEDADEYEQVLSDLNVPINKAPDVYSDKGNQLRTIWHDMNSKVWDATHPIKMRAQRRAQLVMSGKVKPRRRRT